MRTGMDGDDRDAEAGEDKDDDVGRVVGDLSLTEDRPVRVAGIDDRMNIFA